ncbi:MAG TPA: DNA polymerase I [Burkholderiales bacterium]|nr:DNA polymerase I [Burkholderiales bacterium]
MNNTILLIDGSSFIFRAFYAVKNLSAPNGMPTNAIYGIVNMLKQMQKKYTTRNWVCVFDAKGKTFRDEIYPEYKANRRETPDELKVQFPYIHELIADLGIPVIIQDGVEADDVIATIAKKYAALDYQILIATGDKDFAQIVDDKIILVNTMTNEILDHHGVIDKFGVRPDQIIDYLSLIGDSVDNVPGVHKCGPKTAQKWLTEFDSIANLIINQDKLSGVVGENFRQAVEWLPTAQKLITIDCQVNIDSYDIHTLENLQLGAANWSKLAEVYRELNFRTWLKEAEGQLATIAPQSPVNDSEPTHKYDINQKTEQDIDLFSNSENIDRPTNNITLALHNKHIAKISTVTELQSIVNLLIAESQNTSFNIYLDDNNNNNSQLCAVAISNATTIYLIELTNASTQELLFADDSETQQKLLILAKYWQSELPKICFDYKKQLYILAQHNIRLSNISGDLQLASYIQNSLQKHDLAAIINRGAQHTNCQDYAEFLGKGAKRINFSSLDETKKQEFIIANSQYMLEIHQMILSKLTQEEQKLYQQVELPLANLLFQLERVGMKIDISRLKLLSQEMHDKLRQLEDSIQIQAKCVFNVNSPKQLQDILFNQLKLPTTGIKKNTSGYSTDEESLSILAASGFSIADELLEYRYLNKLLNTYIDRLPEYADTQQLVHTSLEQTIVTSGRLSSKDPNLQNIPVRSDYGQAIRECFIAPVGCQLICADYSQIELRILAHISQDKNLIAAFNSGADIHLATASQIFDKPIEEITKDERRYAKSINFGLIYGKSVFGLAKELKIERAAAKLYIDNYFAQYPLVSNFMENIKKFAHRDGYVETIYGRKIYLANINSGNNILRQAEERLALNAPMQGSAADIIKIAMLNVNQWLAQENLQTKMILQVHDELIFQVPNNEVDIVIANLSRLMSEKTQLAVPLEIEVKAAANWGKAH